MSTPVGHLFHPCEGLTDRTQRSRLIVYEDGSTPSCPKATYHCVDTREMIVGGRRQAAQHAIRETSEHGEGRVARSGSPDEEAAENVAIVESAG